MSICHTWVVRPISGVGGAPTSRAGTGRTTVSAQDHGAHVGRRLGRTKRRQQRRSRGLVDRIQVAGSVQSQSQHTARVFGLQTHGVIAGSSVS